MAIDLRAALQAKLAPRSLPVYVAGLRAAGRTWRQIAEELTEKTGVSVSHTAVRTWFRDNDTGRAVVPWTGDS